MSGYEVVKDRWAELFAQMKTAISGVVQNTALDVATDIAATAPRASGEFAGSIEPKLVDATHAEVTSAVPQAIWLEYGTGSKASGQPVEGSVGHRADWPGMPAQPTFTPATEKQRGKWNSRMESVGDKVK